MSPPGRIDRRRFLQAALGAGSALALAGLRPWRALIEVTNPSLADRLTALLDHRRSAEIVGGEYLRDASSEDSARALVDAIAASLQGGPETTRTASRAELQELVAARVYRDFENRNTVNLEGWIVSRTEARLCALAAIRRSRGSARRV